MSTEDYFLWPEGIESPWAVGFRLYSHNSSTRINIIADKHKAFVHEHWKEPVLKQGMDAHTEISSFTNAWSSFPQYIWSTTVARLQRFFGTSTIESVFFVVR